MHGLLAIDIDGTLTAEREKLSCEVVDYVASLVKEGWKCLFVTGRTVEWSLHLLEKLPFSYTLAAFNGAYTMQMPQKAVIDVCLCPCSLLEPVGELLKQADTALVIYGEPNREAHSLYFKKRASRQLDSHLKRRFEVLREEWVDLEELSQIAFSQFIALRAFCHPEVARALSAEIEALASVHAPVMTDSYDSRFSIIQVTNAEASKGHALAATFQRLGKRGKVIACGDDYNDIPMLQRADCRVVMATAPAEVLSLADIIAPPAGELGIIEGLRQAIDKTT
ncbi:MAG: HAD family phosphatase [Verrucomicrobia bacterium]|nr:HAD family phosphatase [Verrucomicrobiota bacterium]